MTGGLWKRLTLFFAPRLGRGDNVEGEAASPSPTASLLNPLDQMRHHALDDLENQRQDRLRQEALLEERRKAEAHQTEMRADIVLLHQQLETGFGEADMRASSESLKNHCQSFQALDRDQLSQMAVWAVMERFNDEALLWAWNELESRLQAHDLSWPPPSGMVPNASPAEKAQHFDLYKEMLRKAFLRGPLLRHADLILGIVPAWRSLYPQKGGAVWTQTVYEGVASALASRRLQAIDQLAEKHHEHLDQAIAQALAPELQSIQERLSSGVSSFVEARNLSDEAVAVCQRIGPKVVWEFLAPLLPE